MDFGFIGPTYQSESQLFDPEFTANLYMETIESGRGTSGAKYGLLGTPGLALIASLGGNGRAIQASTQQGFDLSQPMAFAISGTSLFSINYTGGTATLATGLASEPTGPGGQEAPAQIIILSDDLLFLVAGGVAYQYELSTATLTLITDLTAGQFVRSATFIDGYVTVGVQENVFQISGVLQFTSFDPLDFATKEGAPDNIVREIATEEYLYHFGAQTTEVWQDTGNSFFPFQRIAGGGLIEQGLISPWAIGELDNSIIWWGSDYRGKNVCWQLRGLTPTRVSTHAIEQMVSEYIPANASSITYQENGHFFFATTFPFANLKGAPTNSGVTVVFDSSENMWHVRTSNVAGQQSAHLSRFHTAVVPGTAITGSPGPHITLSALDGSVYNQSTSHLDEAGTEILRDRISPIVAHDNNRVIHYQFELVLVTGQNSVTPVYNLYISDDGGNTWSAPIAVNGGSTGNYMVRVIWRRLGLSRRRVYRVTSSSAVPQQWLQGTLLVAGSPIK